MLARQNDGDKYYAIKILDKSKVSSNEIRQRNHNINIFLGREAKTDRTHPK